MDCIFQPIKMDRNNECTFGQINVSQEEHDGAVTASHTAFSL